MYSRWFSSLERLLVVDAFVFAALFSQALRCLGRPSAGSLGSLTFSFALGAMLIAIIQPSLAMRHILRYVCLLGFFSLLTLGFWLDALASGFTMLRTVQVSTASFLFILFSTAVAGRAYYGVRGRRNHLG